MVKKFHESVRQHIKKKNEQYATKANKGRQQVLFKSGDWIWVHMRKKIFPAYRWSKLHSKGDGPFQVLARESMIMHISWIFQMSITLVLHLIFLIFLLLMCVTIRGRILLKRGGMMRITKHSRIHCMFQLGLMG